VPELPTLASLGVIVGILGLAVPTSVLANRRDRVPAGVCPTQAEAAREPADAG
jgi:hypothetical protein